MEQLKELPEKVKYVIIKYSEILQNNDSYINCKSFKNELNALGYDFDYYMDANHPISIKQLI